MSFGALENLALAEFIERESAPDALWVFVHIPRTGGSSFITELAKFQPDHKHLLPVSDEGQLTFPEKMDRQVDEFVAELGKREPKACSGHISMAQVARITAVSQGAKVIALLRNPVDRIISEFRSIRSYAHPLYDEYVKKYPTVQDFVDANENRDRITRILVPGPCANMDVLRTVDESLAFIGLLEMYPMSFNIITRLLGQNRVPKVKRNATISTDRNQVTADSQLKHRIAKNNELDFAVYEHVKERLISHREAWQGMQVQRRSVSATAVAATVGARKRTNSQLKHGVAKNNKLDVAVYGHVKERLISHREARQGMQVQRRSVSATAATVAATVGARKRAKQPQVNETQIRRSTKLLRFMPKPLLDPGKRVVVVWSPKSACTSVYVWFSSLCGFIGEVAQLGGFPHHHRIEVYYRSRKYRDTVKTNTGDFHVVRIIRDPYSRAVSIFRHALATGFADKPAARAGLDFEQGVSFRQFLAFAASQDMRKSDPHLRPQLHRFESHHKPNTVINISRGDMFEQLNALEHRMGWPVTDFKALAWLHELESSRRPDCEPFEGEHVDEIPIVRGRPPRNTRFPAYGQLLTPAAKSLIEQVYRVDFEAYRGFL